MIACILNAGLVNRRGRRKVTGINIPLKEIQKSVEQDKCFCVQMNYVKMPKVCPPNIPLSVVTAWPS
jgi:hypothetical protein